MAEENLSQEFRLKNIEATKNYLIKKTDQNELMSKKHEKVFKNLNYTEHFLFKLMLLLDVFQFLLLLLYLVLL